MKQGSLLSPLLFNIYRYIHVQAKMKEAMEEQDGKGGHQIQTVRLVIDLAMTAITAEKIQAITNIHVVQFVGKVSR